jgi:hypothetical protein
MMAQPDCDEFGGKADAPRLARLALGQNPELATGLQRGAEHPFRQRVRIAIETEHDLHPLWQGCRDRMACTILVMWDRSAAVIRSNGLRLGFLRISPTRPRANPSQRISARSRSMTSTLAKACGGTNHSQVDRSIRCVSKNDVTGKFLKPRPVRYRKNFGRESGKGMSKSSDRRCHGPAKTRLSRFEPAVLSQHIGGAAMDIRVPSVDPCKTSGIPWSVFHRPKRPADLGE